MQKLVTVLLALALVVCAPRVHGAEDAGARKSEPADAARKAYVEDVVARARALRLHEDRTWLRLLHYRRTLLGGYDSEADGEPFFMAEDGDSDPAAELESTLRGFYDPT